MLSRNSSRRLQRRETSCCMLVKTFSLLEKSGKDIGAGGIICMAEKPFPIDTENSMIPVNLL